MRPEKLFACTKTSPPRDLVSEKNKQRIECAVYIFPTKESIVLLFMTLLSSHDVSK
jgi:hypothetical protein